MSIVPWLLTPVTAIATAAAAVVHYKSPQFSTKMLKFKYRFESLADNYDIGELNLISPRPLRKM